MNFTTSNQSYEMFRFQNHQTLKKFNDQPLLNSFSHLEKNQKPMNSYENTAICTSVTIGSLECENKTKASILNYFLPTCTIALL